MAHQQGHQCCGLTPLGIACRDAQEMLADLSRAGAQGELPCFGVPLQPIQGGRALLRIEGNGGALPLIDQQLELKRFIGIEAEVWIAKPATQIKLAGSTVEQGQRIIRCWRRLAGKKGLLTGQEIEQGLCTKWSIVHVGHADADGLLHRSAAGINGAHHKSCGTHIRRAWSAADGARGRINR